MSNRFFHIAAIVLFLTFAGAGALWAQDAAPEPSAAVTDADTAAPAPDAAEATAGQAEEDAEEEDTEMPAITVAADAGLLRYGADLEGGVPYVFVDPDNENNLLGYEVEMVDAIAKRLGRKTAHVQNDWDKLIPGLTRDLYDIAIQGLEITPEHEEAVDFTIPYYITHLQLCVRKDEFLINHLEDVHGKVVGTLKESLAQYVLESMKDVEVRAYPTEVNGFDDLVNGRLDAVLFDAPVARYYAGPRPEIKFVGGEIGRIAYGIAIAKKNGELLAQVNQALTEMRDSGEMRAILERWGLWNSLVAAEFGDFSASTVAHTEYDKWVARQSSDSPKESKFTRYVSFLPVFGKAAVVTLEVSVLAMMLAIALGFFLATLRVYGPRPVSMLAVLYIEIVRGTPLLIQLFLIFYGLPSLGIKFSPFIAGVVGLGLNYAAYEAENYRAGFLSVPRAQFEAALGLGMSRWQAIRHVIAPQAFRIVLPPVTNDFISLLKDSSLVSIITMVELTKAYGQIATTYYDYLGTGLMVACIYLLIGLPFVRLARWMEKRTMLFDHARVARH